MVRSSPARSNIRPLVIAAVREGPPRERRPRRTPAVILAFPGCRLPEAPPARPPLTLARRFALMTAGALAGLCIAALFLYL